MAKNEVRLNEIFNFTEDIDYQNDCISSKSLTQLSNDVAKLKAKGVVDAINKNKLTLLINFAMRNVDVAKNLSADWAVSGIHLKQRNPLSDCVYFGFIRRTMMTIPLIKYLMQPKHVCWYAICIQRQKM